MPAICNFSGINMLNSVQQLKGWCLPSYMLGRIWIQTLFLRATSVAPIQDAKQMNPRLVNRFQHQSSSHHPRQLMSLKALTVYQSLCCTARSSKLVKDCVTGMAVTKTFGFMTACLFCTESNISRDEEIRADAQDVLPAPQCNLCSGKLIVSPHNQPTFNQFTSNCLHLHFQKTHCIASCISVYFHLIE